MRELQEAIDLRDKVLEIKETKGSEGIAGTECEDL